MSADIGDDPLREPAWVRIALITLAAFTMLLLVALPLVTVLASAFGEGIRVWWAALRQPDALAALRLTLLTASIVVPVNAGSGLLMAWVLARFDFRGKRTLLALIDLPFAVSPVVAGLCLVLLFGAQGWFADLLAAHDVKILFARPGIVLATLFVTFPFVVRELLPLLQQQGADEELTARSLGAGAFHVFFRVTLPNVKWGLLYGVLLCSARALGEFGAVSVVSGHIRGLTNTLPLHIEILYNEFDATAAFAAASLLSGMSLVTLALRLWLERHHGDSLVAAPHRHSR